MRNVGLDEAQTGIKIARRNINNFRYAENTTLMAESQRGTKEPLDEGEKGEWKSWLKTQHSKNKDNGIQSHQFSSVQFSHSVMSDSLRPHELQYTRPPCPSPSITNSRSSPRLTSNESVMPSSHLILCRPLLLLPPIPPSIRVSSNESTLRMRWPKYWSFSFSIIPSKEHPGLISFRTDWLDLLAVQGTLKSLLQHHQTVCRSRSNS